MAIDLKRNAKLHDHLLKQQRLVFDVNITGDATPADKVHATDLPGVAHLRTEGKVASADAVEDLSADWTAASDGPTNSVFGILIDLGENSARKVYRAQVVDKGGTATSLALSDPGGSGDSFVSAEGNIVIEIAGTGLDLEAENAELTVIVDYEQA